jgi:AI-2 transport protein TqsA
MPPTDKTMTGNGPIRVSLVVCAVILACAALYFTSAVFAPLAFALFILAIVWPLQEALEKPLPKGLALFVTLAVTIVVV